MEGASEHPVLAEQFEWLMMTMDQRENDVNCGHLCVKVEDGHFCLVCIMHFMKYHKLLQEMFS